MGQRASQVGALTFTDVRLPAEALLGAAGRDFHMMMSVLDKGRLGIAALAVGIGQAGLEHRRLRRPARPHRGRDDGAGDRDLHPARTRRVDALPPLGHP